MIFDGYIMMIYVYLMKGLLLLINIWPSTHIVISLFFLTAINYSYHALHTMQSSDLIS